MTTDLQSAIAISLVALAGVYVLKVVLGQLWRRGSKACGGGCGSCSANEKSPEGFISLDTLKASPASKSEHALHG